MLLNLVVSCSCLTYSLCLSHTHTYTYAPSWSMTSSFVRRKQKQCVRLFAYKTPNRGLL